MRHAAEAGDLKQVKSLIARGADVNAENIAGATPLMHASSPAVVHALVDAGAKINHRQQGGRTALLLAVQKGALSIVKALVDRGADPFIRDDEGGAASCADR